ncbi:uncharacterized protein clmna [Genypterus blacodes]|uniref:uncharacterized protein clmna n=1 Tax=Genypterus blacodes TaxID=154954 RepID=UPI003F75878A
MAGRQDGGWFEREEFIGQISDIRVQNLQVEREVVQKRTFTRWMNLHLEKCDPPIEVQDLFGDIQDGRILMALLEELSGCKLLHGFKKSSHRIFRLNNIAKVLTFLEERNVKLVSIDAADVADGNSSIILGLIWNIILFFQIKELTGNIRSQFPSTSSLSSIPTSSDSDTSSSTPSEERQTPSTAARDHGRAIKRLLQWVQKRTRKYGVAAQDFGKSWSSGLAFLAVIKSIDSSLVDMRRSLLRSSRENLEDAFRIAHYSLGIRRLLEPEDVMVSSPDQQSIMTYVSQFLEHFPGIDEPEEPPSQVIERSVSMGRLNFREADAELLRNGGHRGRVRERSYMFQKDSVQPPPKILISSVSEDRGVVSPPFTPGGARAWSSVDFLAESTQEEDAPTDTATQAEEPASPQLSDSHSPSRSSVTESLISESVICDSAIGSPDSWVESDLGGMQDRISESHSDSSLCDSGTAWDGNVLPATPEDVEGLTSSTGRASDEQLIPEMFTDEGIYSLSSLESNQERIQTCEEEKKKKKEANGLKLNQDEAQTPHPGQEDAENKGEGKAGSINQEPLVTEVSSSRVSPAETNQSQPDPNSNLQSLEHCEEEPREECVVQSSDRDSECLQEAVGLSGRPQEHEEAFSAGTEGLSERRNSEEAKEETVCQIKAPVLEDQTDEVMMETSETQEEGSEGVQRSTESHHRDPAEPDGSTDPQTRQDTSTHTNIPQILILVEPPGQDQERLAASVGGDEGSCSQRGVLETNIDDIIGIGESWDDDGSPEVSGNVERDDGHQDNRTDPIDKTQCVCYEPAGALRGVDSFYSEFDPADELGGGDPVEPMDLFYPDKEEPMFPEPDHEAESWPSVLSVSALQPAPASPDLDLTAPEQHHASAVLTESHHEVQTPSELQVQTRLPVERTAGLCGAVRPAGGDDEQQSPSSARENTQPVSDSQSSCRPDEVQIPTVLRHRKVSGFTDSKDNRLSAAETTSRARGDNTENWYTESSEFYLLLLLWLLLYCLWVLPQMDLKSLPSLLLNLDH